MKDKKLKILALVAIIAVVVSIGYGTFVSQERLESAQETRTIVDSLGRSVELPMDVERIVSLSVTSTEIISVLGAQDKIVGVDEWVKRGTGYGELIYRMYPELQDLSSPGGGPKPVNIEEVLALDPDVVLVSGVGTGWVEDLEQYGIPVVAAKFESVDSCMDDIRIVAECAGKEKEAEGLIAYLQSKIDLVTSRVGDLPQSERPRVLYVSLRDGTFGTYGSGTFEDEQIRTAGGFNIAAEASGVHVQLSIEQILAANPQVIITHHGTTAEDILSDPRMADVEAVKNKEVYTLPEWGWDFGSLRDIFCIEWLATKLHPDKFSDIDIDAEVNEFYKKVYGIEYSGPALSSSTKTIVDMAGRSVTLPSKVKNIVTVYPPATPIVYAIDGVDHLVGIDCLDVNNQVLKDMEPKFKDIVNVGHQFKGINIEELLSLEPDVVFASIRNRETTMQNYESYFPVVYIDVNTIQSLKRSMLVVGQALDKESRAEGLVSYYNQKMENVVIVASQIPENEKPQVYMTSHGILNTCTSASIESYMLELCGGINVAADVIGGLYSEITIEQLISWNPDIILVNSFCSSDTKDDILSNPRLASIKAVKNKQVFQIPDYISCWYIGVPESLLGMEWTLYKLHPEKINFQMEEEVKEFYSKFYGYDITDEEIAQILKEES
ncbi:MAG: Cobalamin-binding protein precursor [Candidatus Methanolliviera sp. GoM_asphalt]|nr:MAG: Cobalamin-binding protein precursor [Candidatus Methanolliviera sp. GoM_asphalt]